MLTFCDAKITPIRSERTEFPIVQRVYNSSTTREDRIAIRTDLLFKIPYATIEGTLDVTRDQIQYAQSHPVTP